MPGRRPPRGAGEGLLRPPRPEGILALDDTIATLVELDTKGLYLQWRNHLGGTGSAMVSRKASFRVLIVAVSPFWPNWAQKFQMRPR